MSNAPVNDLDVHSTASSSANDHERIEKFNARGPINSTIRTASARVTVQNGPDDTCRVRATMSGSSSAERLAHIEISFDEATNTLLVDTRPKGRRRVRIFDFHNIDLHITMPASSNVELHSASGDVTLDGTYDDVSIASASGDVTAGVVKGSLTVNVASGDVSTGQVHGRASAHSASGDISLGDVSADVNVHAVSGNIRLTAVAPLNAKVHSVSGDVTVTVKPGFIIEVNAKSIAGSVRSEIALDDAASLDQRSENSGVISIDASTVSGDVRIARS